MTLTTPAPARRSTPESFATTAMPSTMTAPLTAAVPAPSRRRVRLGGVATLGVAGVIAAVTVGATAAPAPLPAAPVSEPTSLVGADPSTTRCGDDARTVTSRVITAQQRRFEVPVGTLELRTSDACGTAWARYTLAAASPVAAIAIEGATRQEVPLVARGRVAHGVTPMVDDSTTLRAEAVPADGAVLPSRTLDGGTP